MGLAGAAAEDAEAECIRRITETQIVTGLHSYQRGFMIYNLYDSEANLLLLRRSALITPYCGFYVG